MSPTKTPREVQIRHRGTGIVLAEGRRGWDITPFEGNLYLRSGCVRREYFRLNYVPGLCPYKGIYVWADLVLPGHTPIKNVAWLYWLPNPFLPFIWYRIAVPDQHPELLIEETASTTGVQGKLMETV